MDEKDAPSPTITRTETAETNGKSVEKEKETVQGEHISEIASNGTSTTLAATANDDSGSDESRTLWQNAKRYRKVVGVGVVSEGEDDQGF